ncbi:MAG TPA: NAD-dependent epimerase/dehydratase family protein [Thermoanaerobaculia bacterium]
MRVLVTGAAGFIASNLIPRLLARGDEVIGIDNFFLGKREYLTEHERFLFIELDLLDLPTLLRIFEEVRPDRVWHLAANSDISFGTKYTDFDLKGGTLVTYNVLEAMRGSGTKEIVFSSSGAVYGEPAVMPTPEDYGPIFPISLYAASKVACESLITAFVHNYDLRAWIFRFGNIVGPNPTHGVIYDFIDKLQKDPARLEVLGDGTQSKPYVHVEDCLDGIEFGIAHARAEVNCFNLAVDDQTSVREIAEWTVEAMGLRNVAIHYGEGPRGWRGDVAQVKLDTARMSALGWRPKMSSREATRRAIAEIVAQRT